MTTIKIKGYTCTLSGNALTGKTYEVKNYIKAYLCGKWDSVNSAWIVDVEKLNDLAARPGSYIEIITAAEVIKPVITKRDNGWCNKCQSWCYGDCTAN